MVYQMTVNLNEQQYAALMAEAATSGKQPQTVLDEIMAKHLQQSPQEKRPMTASEFEEKLYREGLIENIPTREPLTPEERDERERLGRVFSGGKPMSEMVIEDRGPY